MTFHNIYQWINKMSAATSFLFFLQAGLLISYILIYPFLFYGTSLIDFIYRRKVSPTKKYKKNARRKPCMNIEDTLLRVALMQIPCYT